jgi:hypothetical protein
MATTNDWSIAGSYFEACNCEAICPCRSIGGRPGTRSTYGVCQFALSWRVLDGHGADVDLSGLDVVMAGFYDDDVDGSPWQVALYIDEKASAQQHDWLERIFLGKAARGNNHFVAAITEVHAVRSARIDLGHDPGAWSMGVDGHVRVDATDLVPCDETVACGIPGLDHPGQELRAAQMKVDEGPLQWDLHGRCAFATDFAYSSTG